ncbi:glycosyltransferase family 2 protein [Mycolicibacterium mengxianglii]|uniref:glycosyltransferase family 2 protein n=1 Tax=Mycolicibacterium mengxianglii TaxID=2736649 RepID=UPI0018D01248|nr:glycosyltransferase family 2 protein [Mycolicibacterium mengxianglii]
MSEFPAATDCAVSVVIAAYSLERLDAIEAALNSVRKQNLPPHRVVLAVDNNPALAELVTQRFDWATVVSNTGGRGASATRNAGAAVVDTEFTAFLDDDETADPDWLLELTRPFADPAVVGTGGRYTPCWGGTRDGVKPAWFPDDFAWVVGGAYEGMPTTTAEVRNVWAGNMAVRTAAFRAVGGFRADFGKQDVVSEPEDTDLCIRMADGRGHWMYVPSAVIFHDVPASRASFAFFLRRCVSEGRGKAALRDRLGSDSAIDVERDYVWRSLRTAVARLLSLEPRRMQQGAAALLGMGCAGAGFAAQLIRTHRIGERS